MARRDLDNFPNLPTDKILLPSHELFRPELSRPPMQSSMLSISTSSKRRTRNPLEAINSKLEEILEELSSKGEFVPLDHVQKIMKDIVKQENDKRSSSSRISWGNVKVTVEYSKLHGRVENLIKVFCLFNPFTTLYELEQAIILTENVQSYEELHMGHLHKHPKVIDLFQLPQNLQDIPQISEFKLRKYLMDFLSKNYRRKPTLEDFIEWVRDKEFAESNYHLCIRISSFGLAIRVS